MNKKIRFGVFETNSSSTHSISFPLEWREGILDTIYPNEKGVVEIIGEEFGWEIEYYNDPPSKAAYVATYCKYWVGVESESYFNILTEVIKGQTGCKEVEYLLEYGYIDHQSVEDRDLDYLFEDVEVLRHFIFNPNVILRTDNDNH